MTDTVQDKLREILGHYGMGLLDDPKRFEALLRDLCGNRRREIYSLIVALKLRVPQEFSADSAGVRYEVLVPRLVQRILDEVALTEDMARWTVQTWATAVGVQRPRPVAIPVQKPTGSSSQDTQRSEKERAPNPSGASWLIIVLVLMVTVGLLLVFAGLRPATNPPIQPKPSKEFTNSLGMRFAWIPPGSFIMGSPPNEAGRSNDEIQHHVKLTKSFWLGVYPVTQAEWQKVMGSNPSRFKGDSRPVEQVSWGDCQEFCRKLSAREGRTYRLPTEAEWEYACRAGTTTTYCFGDGVVNLGEYAWYGGNSNDQTHSVGQKKANGWGLYDMHGNVYQWCQDWYGAYPQTDQVDPHGPSEGSDRVLRGGSWSDDPRYCRSAYRITFEPGGRNCFLSCRLALVPFSLQPVLEKDYDQAIANFTKAIEMDPKYALAYNERGIAYQGRGDYDRAIADYTKAIELDPKVAYAYYIRGLSYLKKGNTDQATADMDRARQLDPSLPPP